MQYFSPKDIYLGYLMSISEMQYQGTTTVLDHAHATWSDEYVDTAVDAAFKSGIRSYFAYQIHTLPNGYTWDDQLSKIQSLADEPRFKAETVSLSLDYSMMAFLQHQRQISAPYGIW